MTDFNEETLKKAIIEIKKHTEPLKPFLRPTMLLVPAATVQEVADEHGITIEEAKGYIYEVVEKLRKTEKHV